MKKMLFLLGVFFFLINNVYATINVSSFIELKNAISNGENNIKITGNIKFNDSIAISSNVIINGNNKIIRRDNGYTGGFISIGSEGSLEIKDVTIDGGAPGWYMDYDNRFYLNNDETSYVEVPTISSDDDIISTSSLISNEGNIVLNNVIIQNNRSTVPGSILSGNGNNTINNSTFKHSCSLSYGGGLSVKGTTVIKDAIFKDLVAGCGLDGDSNNVSSGAINANPGGNLEIIDSIFEDNYAQWNGGALTTYNQNTIIKGTTFRHNMVGNDGSALQLISQNKSFSIDDSVFEKNIGFAKAVQSMGTIFCSYSVNTEDTPLLFKNLIFRENEAAVGGMIADRVYHPYLEFDNIEVYDNKVDSGGAIYAQTAKYSVNNLRCHDNIASTNGGCIAAYLRVDAYLKINNSTIKDNKATKNGGGFWAYGGELFVKNSKIINNSSSSYGGGIYFDSHITGDLRVQNTIIKDNKASSYGGGITFIDREKIFSKITVDNDSKIYDNHSEVAADDFMYGRYGDTNPDNIITLNDIGKAGINGIDGWYIDRKNDRFVDTENPTKYDDFANNNGNIVYLKAAGINDLKYDLNGGENENIIGVTMRYGTTFTVTDEVPVFEGKVFEGWNTKADGSGRWLHIGDTYDGSEGYVLYALYSEIEKDNEIDKKEVIEEEKGKFINPQTKDKIIVFFVLFIVSLLIMVIINSIKKSKTNY